MVKRETPNYEDLAEAIARHVHLHWLWGEMAVGNGPPVKYFDHNFTSQLQITAAVLTKLKIMEPIISGGQLYRFTSPPSEFRRLAIENKHLGCTYDIVVLALIGIVDHGLPQDDLEEHLFALELYETDADGTILHTEKMAYYQHLYSDWPQLIA